MTWQRRVFELLRAGGTVTSIAACLVNCNPAPDPCLNLVADREQCEQCRDDGGSWISEAGRVVGDAGVGVGGQCDLPCPGPNYNCAMDAAVGDDASRHPLPDASTGLVDATSHDGGPVDATVVHD